MKILSIDFRIFLAIVLMGAACVDATAQDLPRWLSVHGEQRVRYETDDTRYRPGESGGDQQLPFRTRLQTDVTLKHLFLYSEIQDSRVALTDAGSTVSALHETRTRLLQGFAAYRFDNVFGSGLQATIEAGRFSRDFGSRRMIVRNLFRNTTNAFDGVVGRIGAANWNLQAFDFRPVVYTFPDLQFDERFRDARLRAAFLTGKVNKVISADAYLLHIKDGDRAPNLTRRDLFTEGFRIFGSAASTDYQAEAALQHGHYGPLVHKAWFTHLQIGEQWKAASKPKVTVLYDYASGDHDPFDEKHNNFETLYGSRRGELGPSGIWGWQSRSNLNSPSVQIQVNPAKDWDLIVHHQWLYLAQARDVWRGAGLGDPSGRSGRSVGQQTETRLHYRWNKWFDFETGYTVLREGSFLRALRPASKGWGGYFYSSSDWHF